MASPLERAPEQAGAQLGRMTAAEAVRPAAGRLASVLFALGIIGTGGDHAPRGAGGR